MKISSGAVALASVFWCATSAHADLVTYSNFQSWSSAVSGVTSVTIPEPPDGFAVISPSVSYGGVLFTDISALDDGGLFNVGFGFSGLPPVISSQQGGFNTLSFLITLEAPVTAFSLNFGTFDGYEVTFLLSNGHSVTTSSTATLYQPGDFFGVTDDIPFSTILVNSASEADFINNIKFGSAISGVPELSTWVLMLLGFAGIALGAYRNSRKGVSEPVLMRCFGHS